MGWEDVSDFSQHVFSICEAVKIGLAGFIQVAACNCSLFNLNSRQNRRSNFKRNCIYIEINSIVQWFPNNSNVHSHKHILIYRVENSSCNKNIILKRLIQISIDNDITLSIRWERFLRTRRFEQRW